MNRRSGIIAMLCGFFGVLVPVPVPAEAQTKAAAPKTAPPPVVKDPSGKLPDDSRGLQFPKTTPFNSPTFASASTSTFSNYALTIPKGGSISFTYDGQTVKLSGEEILKALQGK